MAVLAEVGGASGRKAPQHTPGTSGTARCLFQPARGDQRPGAAFVPSHIATASARLRNLGQRRYGSHDA